MFNWFKKVFISGEASRATAAQARSEVSLANTELLNQCIALKDQGNNFLAKGMLEEATKCYRQAVAINPGYAEGLLNLGFVLREQKSNEDAERYLKQAVLINPKLEDAYYILGDISRERENLDGAIENYKKALELKPDFEIVYRDLPHVLFQSGKNEAAKRVIKQGISIFPESAEFYYYLGNLHVYEKEFDQAIICYQKVLSIQPDNAEAHSLLGGIFKDKGDLGAAEACYRRVSVLNPEDAETFNNLGSVLQDMENLEEAEDCYRKALAIDPKNSDTYNNLGSLFQDRDDLDEAQACYRRALNANPENADAYNNLGAVLQARNDFDEAMACYRKALTLKPSSAEISNNLGVALRNQGNLNEAVGCYRNAIVLKPDFSEAYNNLGNVLIDLGNQDEAISSYRQALAIKPNSAMARNNLGMALQEQGKLSDALVCYRQALESAQESNVGRIKINLLHALQYVCEWNDLEKLGAEVRRIVRETRPTTENQIPPFSFLAIPGTTLPEQRICASNWALSTCQRLASRRKEMGFEFKREHRQKINIGYFSADFRNHPVALLMAEIFELHDRNLFQVNAYSYGPNDGGVMRKRLEESFDHFIDIRNLSFEEAAIKIYEDRIDILVDLTGYTQHARSPILALRPAPIHVNYLGYPGTMGADFVDYLIADRFIIPPELQNHYAEKVVRLPDCYMPRDISRKRLGAPSRKDSGLPEEGFVFCSFNQPYKITSDIFEVWCRLLKAVPGSVLWLSSSNPYTESNLSREAASRGVAPERIIRAPRMNFLEEHLARIQCADLFLDTVPYNAHTTCSDALWMGLPVVTCVGETFPSRVAGSLLTALGMPELITYNLEDYFALALSLATDRGKYEHIRNKVLTNRGSAPLFDSTKFTRHLETAYQQMWDEYAGTPSAD